MIKYSRSKKIIASIVITVSVSGLGIASTQLLKMESVNSATDFLSVPLGLVYIFLVIMVTLTGSFAINSEFKERTGYTLFPNPVSRQTIWLGKFISAEIVGFCFISMFFVIIISAAGIKFGTIPSEIFLSWIFTLLSFSSLMGITFLISSVFKNTTSSAVFVFFLFAFVLPTTDQLLIGFVEVKPWFSPTFSEKIIENSLFTPYPSDIPPGDLPRGPFDVHRFVPYVRESIVVLIGYFFAGCVSSILFFKRQEMV